MTKELWFYLIEKEQPTDAWMITVPLDEVINDAAYESYFATPPDLRVEAVQYIALLPQVYRRLFTLVYLQGYTEQEAGAMLNCTQARISQMVRAGILWMKSEIGGTHEQG